MGINKNSKIYIAGHAGMVGSALVRRFKKDGYTNLLLRTRQELDLLNQQAVFDLLKAEKPDYIIIAAAKVGGILANDTYRAQFIYENLMIQNNLIHNAHLFDVKKLLFLGSSCIYPKNCPQPMKEEYLLTGELEPTNEPYAIAKIAGIKMCESYNRQYGCNFISVMPTNLYGPGDNYNLMTGHVFAAFIRKLHEAKIKKYSNVKFWGTGKPLREFIHVEDLANAAIFVMNLNFSLIYDEGISQLNVGSGEEISIKDLANLIAKEIGYIGMIGFDLSKPDGTLRKIIDSSRLNNLGWRAEISLPEGIRLAYDSYLQEYKS